MPELSEGKAQLATQVDQDVKDAIVRLSQLEGVSQGELVGIAVRAYDAGEVLNDDPELPDDAKITLPIPRDREMLVDCIFNLLSAAKSCIHPTYVMAAMGMAKAQYQKGLPEYKAAEQMRQEWQARREASTRPLAYTKKGPSLS